MDKQKALSLRMEQTFHDRLTKVSLYQRLSINEYILKAVKKEMDNDENLMVEEDKLLKSAKTPCANCGTGVSFYDLKIGNDSCPKCGKKVRMLKSSK